MTRRRATAILMGALFTWASLPGPGSAQPDFRDYRVIVHPANSLETVPRRFLEDAFLKRITRWPDGEPVRPVDLAREAPARREFTEHVLNRSVSAIRSYWQQRIFSGRGLPPPELDSEDEVIDYVLRHRGGVGYVSRRADIKRAKVLLVE